MCHRQFDSGVLVPDIAVDAHSEGVGVDLDLGKGVPVEVDKGVEEIEQDGLNHGRGEDSGRAPWERCRVGDAGGGDGK